MCNQFQLNYIFYKTREFKNKNISSDKFYYLIKEQDMQIKVICLIFFLQQN